MGTITFEQLPEAVAELHRKFDLLLKNRGEDPAPPDPLFFVEQYQDYIEEKTGKRPAKQTIYDQTFKRKIPFERHGKYLYFRKSKIDQWLANGRQM